MRGGPDAAFAVGKEAVRWHSVVDFQRDTVTALVNRWHALYDRRGQPVIVARPFGTAGGELILVGDSYFLSNEGLRNEPSPALLAALGGGGRRVIFDESHLNITRSEPIENVTRCHSRVRKKIISPVSIICVLFSSFCINF